MIPFSGVNFFSEALIVTILLTALGSAIPIMLAAIGETIGEQSGMLNIGIEGVMLTGGFFGFAATLMTDSFWVGFIAGALAGVAMSLTMLVLAVFLGLNQIVIGMGMILAGTGLTGVLYNFYYGESKPRLGLIPHWEIPLLSKIPYVGSSFFQQPGIFYLSLLAALITSLWMYKTLGGLRLRAAGQNPASLDAAGGNVRLTRALATLFGGAMSGLAGAYLALVSAGTFTPGMTHGMGFLAIVVAMLARGKLLPVVAISFGYGLFVALGTALQLTSINIPNDVVTMMPFVAVLIVLTLFTRKSSLPPALAVPYVRGARI